MRGISFFVFQSVIIIGVFVSCKTKDTAGSEPQAPVVVSKYSHSFNQFMETTLNQYAALTEAFVQWDSAAVAPKAVQLAKSLDSIKLDEVDQVVPGIRLAAQTLMDSLRTNSKIISGQADLESKRRQLNTLTDKLYKLLNTIRYDRSKIYLQECPMAFNDIEPGIWISKSAEIRNPYLGLHHPMYGKGMLKCGETKDTLNFRQGK